MAATLVLDLPAAHVSRHDRSTGGLWLGQGVATSGLLAAARTLSDAFAGIRPARCAFSCEPGADELHERRPRGRPRRRPL